MEIVCRPCRHGPARAAIAAATSCRLGGSPRACPGLASRLVGHSSTVTTETIHPMQIRPVIVHGADVTDWIFPDEK